MPLLIVIAAVTLLIDYLLIMIVPFSNHQPKGFLVDSCKTPEHGGWFIPDLLPKYGINIAICYQLPFYPLLLYFNVLAYEAFWWFMATFIIKQALRQLLCKQWSVFRGVL